MIRFQLNKKMIKIGEETLLTQSDTTATFKVH